MKRHLNSFRLRWITLAVVFLSMAGARVQAQSQSETRAFEAAQMAFSDHAWDRAESGFGEFLKKYPASGHYADAVLFEARARLELAKKNQTNYTAVVDLLSAQLTHAGSAADQFVYWTATAYFESGNYQAAADAFARLIKEHANSSFYLEAVFREADSRSKMNDWAGVIQKLSPADGAFQQAARTNQDNDFLTRGFLLLAEAELEQRDFGAANGALGGLSTRKLPPELEWRRQCLRCSIELAAGHAEEALQNSTNLLDAAGDNAELKARSIMLRGEILEHVLQYPEAIKTYETNLSDGVAAKWQRPALLKIVELNLQQDKTDEAARRLEDFLAKNPSVGGTDFELLALGELRLKQQNQSATAASGSNYLAQAKQSFQKIINNFTNSEYIGKAQLNLGWCWWAEGKMAESQAAFSNAVQRLPFSEDQATARFKLADTMYQQTNYAAAISNYNGVIDQYGSLEAARTNLFERALYQIVRAGIDANELAVSAGALDKLLTGFPGGQWADQGMLLLGEARSRNRDFSGARELFVKLTAKSPASVLTPKAKLDIAGTYEKEGDWTSAINQYDNWVATYTNDPALPAAEFSLAWAKSEAGLTNAIQDFTNFVAQFPTNELTLRAQYWIGDYFFNQEEYVDAEKKYQEVFRNTNAPVSNLMLQARMMAGRAAMARQQPDEAIGYFTDLLKEAANHPDACSSNFILQVTYACGDAYMFSSVTNHYINARNLFQSIVSQTNDSIVPLAWGELGNCYLQLAVNDPAQYDLATNAYQKVIESQLAGPAARSMAECGLAQALESQARQKSPADRNLLEQALDHYQNVIYGKKLRDGEKGDPDSMKTAGLAAGLLAEELQKWDQAVRLYDRLAKMLPALQGLDAKRARAQKSWDQIQEK